MPLVLIWTGTGANKRSCARTRRNEWGDSRKNSPRELGSDGGCKNLGGVS